MQPTFLSTLSSVVVDEPVSFKNIAMFPLLARASSDPRITYLTLDDALAQGVVEITEVSARGSVPELHVRNSGATPVLLVDGEELVGAKQNRVINLSIMVPASADLTIPVSCVEAGRWRARSSAFAAAPRTQYATGRAKRMSQVTNSIRVAGVHVSDQAEVWADIAEKSARLGASSPTAAMEAIYTSHASFTDTCVSALRPLDDQVGALFAVGGRVVGFDLFDRPSTLRKLLPKLVRSVAIDALDTDDTATQTTCVTDAQAWLERLASAQAHTAPAVGMGEDVRLSSPTLTGAALAVDGTFVHSAAFAIA
jgi:hypothetical protein